MLGSAFVAPVAGAAPAEDEYTLNIPGGGGSHNPGPGPADGGDPASLPPATQQALQASPDGEVLGAIATSRELGAPGKAETTTGGSPVGGSQSASTGSGAGGVAAEVADSSDERSIPAVLADAADDGSSLPLLAIILATAAIAGFLVVRRRTSLTTS